MPFPDFAPSIPVLLRTAATRHGGRTLMVHGSERMTYEAAERRSADLARGLLGSGVGKGTRVGILMPNGPGWLVAFLAAARIGALVVPVNTFFQARELGWLLRHADVHTLLAVARFRSHDYLERLEACAPELARHEAGPLLLPTLPYLRQVRVWGEHERRWAESGPALADARLLEARIDQAYLRAVEEQVGPADPLVVIYTSGSTAEPRGAIHTHGAVVRHAYNVQACAGRDLTADDRIWSSMPFFWVGGLVVSLLGTLHAGACLLSEDSFDPATTLDLLERERATIAAGWPHHGKALAAHPSFAGRDLSSLRAGMAELLPAHRRPADPTLATNALGMTETCGPHSFGRDDDPPHTRRGGFGRAIQGLEHRIVDPETGAALPAGTPGEICVRGYSLMQGFYKVERERTFTGDGFYRTGDGGFVDADGFLFFTGRLGEAIKTAGASVAPAEIEALLTGYSEIGAAYVVGIADAQRGQSVAAAVVLRPGCTLEVDELRARLRRELAAYKVPRQVFVYRQDELPFTASGKIDKRRLAEMLAARAAGDASESSARGSRSST